ncbi:rab11 family-interacting protein 1 isoform X2 [Labrus bergylta]|uniref:rab11 family-interacting protein 1 isoform X2 n=1 Tax=Labrus bergylta TaxID=56723 RepID=UPI0033135F40
MSLADQSQQWFPTSVQVTVHQGRNLRAKGKNGTNDAYAIMQVAKDKFSTSVAEKSVAPVWKEEASFDLPLFHPGNAERCTLHVVVMHRAHVGLDKFLGQAVVNLLDLHDNNSRKKTDWFKLVDKSGKEDKARGEVLLDIIFMRNNMSASMFDLSMQDKPRSRISKLKDKVRGKKKDGFSDSASAIVPSVSQVLTDSEGEPDAQSLNQFPGTKKKSKLKTLFAPKSNLQRNVSQSMSTLGTLPEKNSSLSGSRSSGLNVDSPEGKKKFKFLGHKRSGSSDSKVSQGPFSLLGRNKQSNSDQNNLCINGSHVYTEEESKSGSTLSLNSSGQGSVEDVRNHTSEFSADALRSAPVPSILIESTDKSMLEQRRHLEEEERRQAEERRIAEAKRLEEEEKYKAAAKSVQEEEEQRLQEVQERKRRFLEDEAKRKKQEQEEELRMREAAEKQKLEEERRKADEQKRQEEASMSDRLSSLFGIIKKKEEKKEEVPQFVKEELPSVPHAYTNHPLSSNSTNPFEDISLSSDRQVGINESPADHLKSNSNPQPPSAMVFLNRNAKVSAVKPRSPQSLESEPTDSQFPSQPSPSPATSEPTLSSVPSDSPDIVFNLDSSFNPPNLSESLSGSPCGSTEDWSSVGSSPTMADKKKRAPLPPSHGTQTGGNHLPIRELKNPAYVDVDGLPQGNKLTLPLPDYETLFPQKRHGVQGTTRWDNLIAEVSQRNREPLPELVGPEMSVDGPQEPEFNRRSSHTQESPAMILYQTHETKPVSSKKGAAPAPPKSVALAPPRSVTDSSQRQTQNISHQPLMTPNQSPAPLSVNSDVSSRESLSSMPRDGARKVLSPSPAAVSSTRPTSQIVSDRTPQDDQRQTKASVNKEPPTAKPRQRANDKETVRPEDSAVTPVDSDKNLSSNIETSLNMGRMDKKSSQTKENFAEFDPFPSTELLSKDPWAQPKQSKEVDLFAGGVKKDLTLEDCGITAEDLDNIFKKEKPTDQFDGFNGSDSNRHSENTEKDDPGFLRRNSSRRKQTPSPLSYFDNKTSRSVQEPAKRDNTSTATATKDESVTPKLEADVKPPSSRYRGGDAFGADPFTLASSQPLSVVTEEPASQAGGVSRGKAPVKAWVSPSEGQSVNAQNSNGGGLALSARRPHPVKPMSSAEKNAFSSSTVKEIKDSTPGTIQVGDAVQSGPYTQLTQEELITLVVKQQTDLSRKDTKIVELEEYIDNLLVRVIDEKPTILQSLNAKPV